MDCAGRIFPMMLSSIMQGDFRGLRSIFRLLGLRGPSILQSVYQAE